VKPTLAALGPKQAEQPDDANAGSRKAGSGEPAAAHPLPAAGRKCLVSQWAMPGFYLYIMAVGGAGSSGDPARDSGKRIM